MPTSFKSKRFHIIIDAFDCDVTLLRDEAFLINLEQEITRMLEMQILKGPVPAVGFPEYPGLSVFSIIDFSHISIHTFTDTKEFYLDIFSCKPFDYSKLEVFIKKTFRLSDDQIFKTIVRYDK